MPKVVSQQELADIALAVANHPDGISIDALMQTLPPSLPRRTLQRRLAELIANGTLIRSGERRGSRYKLAPNRIIGRGVLAPITGASGHYVPISLEGKSIQEQVRRPIAQRTPVGYRRAFLTDYAPNQSTFLPDDVRVHLHEIGRSLFAERPAGTYARDILNRLLIDLSWASSRLEGNTYTRLDTQNLIEFGQAAESKDRRETQMILNHKAAIEMLVENAEEIGFNAYTFLNLHALLSENLLHDSNASGRLRTRIVEISGSVFYPLGTPQQIEECFRLLLEKADAILDPFEQAFFLMVQIPYLQPFEDVNKRVSRLGANIPLIKRNLAPLSFVDVSETIYVEGMLGVYELNRIELLRDVFVWAYERSSQRYRAVKDSLPEPDVLRLKNRQALIEVVNEVVRGGHPIDVITLRRLAAPIVDQEDLDQFVAMAFNDLHYLHEGNITRYRLRLSEYKRWKESQNQAQ